MGYSSWGRKELDTTEPLTLSLKAHRTLSMRHLLHCRDWWSYHYHLFFIIISISQVCQKNRAPTNYYENKEFDSRIIAYTNGDMGK